MTQGGCGEHSEAAGATFYVNTLRYSYGFSCSAACRTRNE